MHAHMLDASLLDDDGDELLYPPHQRYVEVGVKLGAGDASSTVLGSDLTKEYVAINADYRS